MQVGWIFTDLVSEDTRKGTVRYSRNKVRWAGMFACLDLVTDQLWAALLGISAQFTFLDHIIFNTLFLIN